MEEQSDDEGADKAVSYRDKVLNLEEKTKQATDRGCSMMAAAWKEYIDGLKGFFSTSEDISEASRLHTNEGRRRERCPSLKVTQEEYESWCAPWRRSLIIKPLGINIPLFRMRQKLETLWKFQTPFKLLDLENGYFIASFSSDEDLNFVYQEGPWMVADHYLLVQRWRPNFDPWNAWNQRKVAAWVRIRSVPVEFYNYESLYRIGSMLGRTLKVDLATSLSSRGRFARVCVEIDLQLELLPSLRIFGRKFVLEYEGLHLVCFKCGIYGHRQEECPSTQYAQEESLQRVQQGAVTVETDGGRTVNLGEKVDTHEMTTEANESDGTKSDQSKRSWGECVTENKTELAGGDSSEMKFGPENLHKRQVWKPFPGTDIQGGKSVSSLSKEKSAPNSSRDKSAVIEGERYRLESRKIGEKKGQDQQQGSRGFNDKAFKKMEDMVASVSVMEGNGYIGETSMVKDKEGVQHVSFGSNRVNTKQKVWAPIGHKPNQVGYKGTKGRTPRSSLAMNKGPIQQVSLLKSPVDIPMSNPFSILNEQSTQEISDSVENMQTDYFGCNDIEEIVLSKQRMKGSQEVTVMQNEEDMSLLEKGIGSHEAQHIPSSSS